MKTLKYIAVLFWAFTTGATASDCIPFVTVPQLLQNAQNYHQQVIVVEGWTRRGLEYFTIQATREPFQREQIWLDSIDFIKATESILTEPRKLRATNEPALDREAQQKYRKLFSLKRPTHVVLKGEFQTSKESVSGYGSYQHRLVVYEVISIEK